MHLESTHLFAPGNVTLDLLTAVELSACASDARPAFHRLLSISDGARPDTLRVVPIRGTPKSQVYELFCGGVRFIGKHHRHRYAFERELAAYLMFKTGPIPRLVAHCEVSQMLIMAPASGTPFRRGVDDLRDVAAALASAHSTAHENLRHLGEALRTSLSIGSLLRAACSADAGSRFLEVCAEVWGEDHIQVAIQDLNQEHVFIDRSACTFLDLETTTMKLPEVHDLLCLMNLCESTMDFLSAWRRGLAAAYADGLSHRISVGAAQVRHLTRAYLRGMGADWRALLELL